MWNKRLDLHIVRFGNCQIHTSVASCPYVGAILIFWSAELLLTEAVLLQAGLDVGQDGGADGGGAGEHYGAPVHPGLHAPTILS